MASGKNGVSCYSKHYHQCQRTIPQSWVKNGSATHCWQMCFTIAVPFALSAPYPNRSCSHCMPAGRSRRLLRHLEPALVGLREREREEEQPPLLAPPPEVGLAEVAGTSGEKSPIRRYLRAVMWSWLAMREISETSRLSDHNLCISSMCDMSGAILPTSFRCRSLGTLATEATTSRTTDVPRQQLSPFTCPPRAPGCSRWRKSRARMKGDAGRSVVSPPVAGFMT